MGRVAFFARESWREIQIFGGKFKFWRKIQFFLRKIQILNKSIKTVTQSILKRIRWTMEWYKVNERTKKKRMGFETRI